MRVFVYYNLHKKVWSVRAMEGPDKGRVIQHARTVVLQDATAKVSEAGRQRVLREGRKNVHAGMVGTLLESSSDGITWALDNWRGITYNPYKGPSFVYRDSGRDYSGSTFAIMTDKRVFV